MDSNLEKTLRNRKENEKCIICGVDISARKISTIMLKHFFIGAVEICENHIISSEQIKAS